LRPESRFRRGDRLTLRATGVAQTP
jgi:hypothetical protein